MTGTHSKRPRNPNQLKLTHYPGGASYQRVGATDFWECASRTANDDILRCSAFEPHRVDDVEENCESKQRSRGHVQQSAEGQNGAYAKY